MLFLADLVECDNGSVEASNAGLRRRAKAALQCRYLDLQDLSMYWVFDDCRAEASSLFGTPIGAQVGVEKEEQQQTQQRKGGGGTARAWISIHKHEFKLPNNELDVHAATKAYSEAKARDPEAVIAECEAVGRLATLAWRENGLQQGSRQSAFGTIRSRDILTKQRQAATQSVIRSLEQARGGPTGEWSRERSIVPFRAGGVVHDVLATHVGDSIADQVKMLRRVALMYGQRRAALEKEQRLSLRESCLTQTSTSLLAGFESPIGGSLCCQPGDKIASHVWSDHAVDSAIKEMMDMLRRGSKIGGIGQKLQDSFKTTHVCIRHGDQEPIGELAARWVPTVCFNHGYGTCLCTGPGVLLNLARKRFSKALFSLCPSKGTDMRRWLVHGFFVVHFPRVDAAKLQTFFHIALMYLRPVRPTVIQLHEEGDSLWGRKVLRVVHKEQDDDASLLCLNEVELMQYLDLREKHTFRIFKLVSCSRAVAPFVPGNDLLIDELSKVGPYADAEREWWSGAAEELAKEREREAAKQARDAERRKRQAAGGQPKRKAAARSTGGGRKRGRNKQVVLQLEDGQPEGDGNDELDDRDDDFQFCQDFAVQSEDGDIANDDMDAAELFQLDGADDDDGAGDDADDGGNGGDCWGGL